MNCEHKGLADTQEGHLLKITDTVYQEKWNVLLCF